MSVTTALQHIGPLRCTPTFLHSSELVSHVGPKGTPTPVQQQSVSKSGCKNKLTPCTKVIRMLRHLSFPRVRGIVDLPASTKVETLY